MSFSTPLLQTIPDWVNAAIRDWVPFTVNTPDVFTFPIDSFLWVFQGTAAFYYLFFATWEIFASISYLELMCGKNVSLRQYTNYNDPSGYIFA
jgi:hypothetical protein